MGTQEEEARALAELERIRTENAVREMQRQEELRKLQEQQNQNKMVADGPAAIGWPDNEVQAPPGRLDAVKGALGVGAAGDAALAAKLLNSGQAPLGSATPLAKGTDGAKEGIASASAAKPALGLG